MPMHRSIDAGTKLMFTPKVKPDPVEAQRLAEKFEFAILQMNQDPRRRQMFLLMPPPVIAKREFRVIRLLAPGSNGSFGA